MFSGQDFLSSQTRSTLLGDSDIDQLVRNAVAWVGNPPMAEMRVLTDNDVLTALLSDQGYRSVETTFINFLKTLDDSRLGRQCVGRGRCCRRAGK